MGVEETKTEAKKTISNGSKFPEKAAESVTEKKEVENGVKEMEVDKKDVENEAEERTDGNGKEEVRAVEEEKKDSEKSSSKKRKVVEKTQEPMTPGIDRPVCERKSVERLVATIENDASKEFHIEKGQGTPLNEIPNGGQDTNKKTGENEKRVISMASQLYLHPSESPNMSLVPSKFNGTNYDLWADAFRNGLDAKNKLGFIDGKVRKPPGDEGEDNIELVAWRQCNAMVRGWLRSSIEEKLHRSISFSGGVKEIWDELRGRYTAGNAPRVHQLKGELGGCKQKNESVTEYYKRLKVIWDELANYSKVPPCTCGSAAAFAKEREDERVHQFLMGLDDKKYGHIRTNILMEDPIISLNWAYGLVLREETHANMVKTKEEMVEAAMAVKTYGTGRGRGGAGVKEEKIPHCTACGKDWHTEDVCYDKHGYETVKARGRGRGRRGASGGRGNFGRGGGRYGGRGAYQANAVGTSSNSSTTDTGSLSFNNEEIERIRIMLASSPEGNDKLTGPANKDGDWTV